MIRRFFIHMSAVGLTLLAGTPILAQTPPVPDGSRLGDWIALDNKLSFSKLQKDLPGGAPGSPATMPGAIRTTGAVPTEASAPKVDAPKPRPPVTTALYGMTSSEGDQFRGLLQWGDRVYAVRVGGYVKQWRVKKISERGTLLVGAHGLELFAPLDVDGGEIATPVSRPQVVAAQPSLQPMASQIASPVIVQQFPSPVGVDGPKPVR